MKRGFKDSQSSSGKPSKSARSGRKTNKGLNSIGENKYREKNKFHSNVIYKCNSLFSLSRQDAQLKLSLLAKARRKLIEDFTTNIFTVKEIFPQPLANREHSSSSLSPRLDPEESVVLEFLADAMQNTYVNGRWVNSNELSGELHYQVVAPLLCSSGDYSAYNAWDQEPPNHPALEATTSAATNPAVTGMEVNPAHTISAGLLFTSQLLQHIISILDVVMPRRLRFADFGAPMSEYKFAKSVCRLNVSIMYLCLAQGVDAEKIRPKQTVHNLKLLLDGPFDLGLSFKPLKHQNYLCQKTAELFQEVEGIEKTEKDILEVSEENMLHCNQDIILEEDDWDAVSDADVPVMMMKVGGPWSASASPVSSEGIASSTISTASHFVSSFFKNISAATGSNQATASAPPGSSGSPAKKGTI